MQYVGVDMPIKGVDMPIYFGSGCAEQSVLYPGQMLRMIGPDCSGLTCRP